MPSGPSQCVAPSSEPSRVSVRQAVLMWASKAWKVPFIKHWHSQDAERTPHGHVRFPGGECELEPTSIHS